MRFLSVLYARNVTIQKDVPFQELLPLKLKSKVSGKGSTANEVCCLYEMSIMLACFKDKEFNQTMCAKEIENFKKCYVASMEDKRLLKEREAKGIIAPGEKKLTHKQVTSLLKKYPMV
ncbi:small ribosomal subunit protein mS37 [Onthophagus taurus]|uniref:small ribosomal subunit protein mS37 n=1 Tax=Onthophagus taurus TaxID=166361 RepID=UPI000C202C86|nr:coiled-coil-helix-coiled-coil-helix domain-containing protein 1 [Onthophagus taurus]